MFHSSLALIFDNNKLFVSGNLSDHLGLNVGTRDFVVIDKDQLNNWDLCLVIIHKFTCFPMVMIQLEGAHTFCEYFSQRVSGFTFFTSFFSSRHCHLILIRFIDIRIIFMVKTNIYHDFMIPYSLPSSQAIRHISVDCEQSLEGRHYLYLLEKKEISQYYNGGSCWEYDNAKQYWDLFEFHFLYFSLSPSLSLSNFLINCNSVCCSTQIPLRLIIDLLWLAVRSHFVCVVTSQTGWSSSIVISL